MTPGDRRWRAGRASAHDAQYAVCRVLKAERSPSPPWVRGSCARKWWEGFPSIDEVCQALAHGRVMVCCVRGGVRRGQGAEQIICSGCAAKEEQEECDLRVLNSRDRGQELSLCDVFVVQGRGHIVRVSEGGAEDLESLRVG